MLQKIEKFTAEYIENQPGNTIQADCAIETEITGLPMFEQAIIGTADAGDTYFDLCREDYVIGPHFMRPKEWVEGAKSVISVFLPITKPIRQSNRKDKEYPSTGWLHARIEGQEFINKFCKDLKNYLEEYGLRVVVPSIDSRFRASSKETFTSNWSERHAAYACGLGTFSLSKGLITSKGTAGRLCSFITDAELETTERPYSTFEEYCNFCGACIRKCPAGAITMEMGKNHVKCGAFVDRTREVFAPRYGCGKCQTGVPCEAGIPKKR